MFWALTVLIYAAASIGTSLISSLLRPKMGRPGTTPFEAPTADEGRGIPVVFGTVKLSSPNVLWYGETSTNDYIPTNGGIIGLLGPDPQPVATQYFTGLWMGLCHGPVDELVQITAGGKFDVPFSTTPSDGERLLIAFVGADDLFGGILKEGGLQGVLEFFPGSTTQEPSPWLSDDRLGAGVVAPALRGICHAVGTGLYVGTQNVMKPFAFVVRRCPDPLGEPTLANINGGANPAFCIREIATNAIWGMGLPEGRIDDAYILAAAATLKDEGLGYSDTIDTDTDAEDLIDQILHHIDGVFSPDQSTGLWTLRLARADYDPDDIPVFNEGDARGEPKFSRNSWEETLNHVRIRYTGADYKEAIAEAHDSANFASRNGELATDTMDFRGITDKDVAFRIAMRELRVRAWPLVKLRITLNRKASGLRVADVFKLSWTKWGLLGMIFRVLSVNRGTLEDGKIEIEACEDVFGIGYSAFADPGASQFVLPEATRDTQAIEGVAEIPVMQGDIATLTSHAFVAGSVSGMPGTYWLDDLLNDAIGRITSSETDIGSIGSTVYSDILPRLSAVEDVQFWAQGLDGRAYNTTPDGVLITRSTAGVALEVGSDVGGNITIQSQPGSDFYPSLSLTDYEREFAWGVIGGDKFYITNLTDANTVLRVEPSYVERSSGIDLIDRSADNRNLIRSWDGENEQWDWAIGGPGGTLGAFSIFAGASLTEVARFRVAGQDFAGPMTVGDDIFGGTFRLLNPITGIGSAISLGDGNGVGMLNSDGYTMGGFDDTANLAAASGSPDFIPTNGFFSWYNPGGPVVVLSSRVYLEVGVGDRKYLYIP